MEIIMKQHLTHLILEMIGEDSIGTKLSDRHWNEQERYRHNDTLENLREKVPELVDKINNLIEYDKMSK